MPPSASFTIVEGLTTVPSNFGPKETMDRLETEIRTKGLEVFAPHRSRRRRNGSGTELAANRTHHFR